MPTREARIEAIKERIKAGREKHKQRTQAMRESLARQEKRSQQQLQRLTNLERVKERKLDTRRKILVGALVFKKCKDNDEAWDKFVEWSDMNSELKRDNDRALFGLAPLEPEGPDQEPHQPDPHHHDGQTG